MYIAVSKKLATFDINKPCIHSMKNFEVCMQSAPAKLHFSPK